MLHPATALHLPVANLPEPQGGCAPRTLLASEARGEGRGGHPPTNTRRGPTPLRETLKYRKRLRKEASEATTETAGGPTEVHGASEAT